MSGSKEVAAHFDQRQVQRAFVRAAARAERLDVDAAPLVAEITGRMLERLDYVKLDARLVVDAGCGAGGALPGLAQRFPAARVVGFDYALPAARQATAALRRGAPHWLQRLFAASPISVGVADFSQLPLVDATVDCVWSNLALHWHADPPAVVREWHRVLREGGLVQFSTLGPDTLRELRAASIAAGNDRVHRFIDMHDFGDMLVHAGFADPVMDMETLTLTYSDIDRLFADLRAAGATSARSDRPRGLGSRDALRRLRAAYAASQRDGVLPATFEIVYGHAWKPAPLRGRATDGVAVIRPEDIGRGRGPRS